MWAYSRFLAESSPGRYSARAVSPTERHSKVAVGSSCKPFWNSTSALLYCSCWYSELPCFISTRACSFWQPDMSGSASSADAARAKVLRIRHLFPLRWVSLRDGSADAPRIGGCLRGPLPNTDDARVSPTRCLEHGAPVYLGRDACQVGVSPFDPMPLAPSRRPECKGWAETAGGAFAGWTYPATGQFNGLNPKLPAAPARRSVFFASPSLGTDHRC